MTQTDRDTPVTALDQLLTNVEYLMEEHGTRLIDIEDLRAVVRDQKRALASSEDVAGSGERHGVEYDPEEDWLTVTDDEGATQIVAFQVPAWFGVRVVAAFDALAAPTTEAPPADDPE